MGIFDDIVQGINREVSRVQARSQEMLQTYTLTSQIKQLESKITSAFIEIGRLTYDKFERNKEVSEDTLREKTAEISAWEREIVSLRAELDAIKAQFDPEMPASQKAEAKAGYTPTPGFNCPHCNSPASQDKAFCPSCGGCLRAEAEDKEGGNGGADGR